MALPPAGWYLDPQTSATMRWWSGESWTEHQQPLATENPSVLTPAAYVPMGAAGSGFAGHVATGTVAVDASIATSPRLTGRAARVENERQARRNNVFAWMGLLFAVISFVFNPFALLSIVAVVFASVGLGRAQRLRDAGAPFTGRGTAAAGLAVGIIALLLFVTRAYLAIQATTF